MSGEPTENTLYHFSGRIVFFSVLILAVQIAWYVMASNAQTGSAFARISPDLVFARSMDVSLKPVLSPSFSRAEPDQELMAGSIVRTGAGSYAEIRLEDNLIRLDEKTEAELRENNSGSPEGPRLVFRLHSGTLWIRAFDPVMVATPKSETLYSHATGLQTYTEPYNRVMTISGTAHLSLLISEESRVPFLLPFQSQAAFADTQIIPEYTLLQHSKLKKELRLGPVPQEVLEDGWVRRNRTEDRRTLSEEGFKPLSAQSYALKDRYAEWIGKLSFASARKRGIRLRRIGIQMDYLMGEMSSEKSGGISEQILFRFGTLLQPLLNDPGTFRQFAGIFYSLPNAAADTVTYETREKLRTLLISRDPDFVKTYLQDLDDRLRSGDLGTAVRIAELWSRLWFGGQGKNSPGQWEDEARLYQSLMLTFADRVSKPLTDVLEGIQDERLKRALNPEEALYEIALEKLDFSKRLVAEGRYPEAKAYLKTGYSRLSLESLETSAAAKEVFLKESILIADRIDYLEKAEPRLLGSAPEEGDAGFLDYLNTQERDRTIEERFKTFLESSRPKEAAVAPPQAADVVRRFEQSRLLVDEAEVIPMPEASFQFEIRNGLFAERGADGAPHFFSARYDFISNAVYDAVLDQKPVKGSYQLNDFSKIASEENKEHAPGGGAEGVDPLLILSGSGEAQRSQAVAQDLAIQLTLRELKKAGISIPGPQSVTAVNPATLAEFRIAGALLEDPVKKRMLKASFTYSPATGNAGRIFVDQTDVPLPDEIPAAELASAVFRILYGKEEESRAVQDMIRELSGQGIVTDAQSISFQNSSLSRAHVKKARPRELPAEFSGVYDRSSSRWKRAESALYSAEEIASADYLRGLSQRFVVNYLGKQGIAVLDEHIQTPLPSEKIQIRNYARGDKILDFVFDVTNNRLLDVSLQGSDARAGSMTFEEFSRIGR